MSTEREPSDDAEAREASGEAEATAGREARSSAAAPPEADDEAEDPTAEEEDEQEPASERPAPAPRRKKKRGQRRAPAPPPEVSFFDPLAAKSLDVPSKLTLRLIIALTLLVLGMWVGAVRFCNVQGAPPKQPRLATTEQLASTPKDAALELMLRWASEDAASALELAKEPLASRLEKERAACDSNAPACAARRDALAGKVTASAVLLSQEPASAVVRVHLAEGGSQPAGDYLLELEREGPIWKTKDARPDDGSFVAPQRAPAPSEVEPALPSPAPSASAAP